MTPNRHELRKVILKNLKDIIIFKAQLLPVEMSEETEEDKPPNDVIRHEINVLRSAHDFIQEEKAPKKLITLS